MQLSKRPVVYTFPSYSLTADLLSFLRCGLQYRYNRIGQLPSSRPIQMWFGQFIHGVLEEAYRCYAEKKDLPPWPEDEIANICKLIKARLAAQGLFAWDEELERLGDKRAKVAVNELGPELFPIVHRAEVRLTGTRALPEIPSEYRFRNADRYEIVGVVDVITHLELHNQDFQNNCIVQAVRKVLTKSLPTEFEVIIDYKGMRRPPMSSEPSYWKIFNWQIQTYAHLRRMQEDSLPIVAGVILFLNELLPTTGDLAKLRKEIKDGMTDVTPEGGSREAHMLSAWKTKNPLPQLPLEFRLRRAIQVIPVSDNTIEKALKAFDNVVKRIEICRGKELLDGKVIDSWEKNSADEGTCDACDARTFCPEYKKEKKPRLPSVKI